MRRSVRYLGHMGIATPTLQSAQGVPLARAPIPRHPAPLLKGPEGERDARAMGC